MTTELASEAPLTRIKAQVKKKMGPWGVFLEGFMKNPVMVGSIVPSSRFTINRVLAPVDWENTRLFVEYGPGVGTFCQPVLDRLRRDAMLLVIDTNPMFIDYLKRTITDSRFVAVLGSAADVEDIVRANGHEKADYIISGLPFSTLPDGVGPAIAAATYRVLRKGGAFMVYQFTPRAGDFMAQFFRRIDKGLEWINVPPCFLFCGWKDEA